MSEHEHHVEHHSHETVVAGDLHPRISWGAIFAGLVVTVALCWLFHMFGLALGVSLADAYDSSTIEGGLDDGAAIWTLASWIVAFFLGALVSARLAGPIDDFAGMLHGLTMWGAATVVTMVLTYAGISMLMQAGQTAASGLASGAAGLAQGTAQTVGAVASGVGQATYSAGQAASSLAETDAAQTVQNRLMDQAIDMAAEMDEQLSEQDIRDAINSLDQRTLRRVTQDLVNNDSEGAAELLADSTELSQRDARALIDATYEELEEAIGNPDNNESLRQDVRNQLARQIGPYVASLDEQGGADVSGNEVRDAIKRLDARSLNAIAMALINGEPERARRVLSRQTNLTREEIDALYEGAESDLNETLAGYQQEIEELKAQANRAAETAVDYGQAVLWIAFGGAAASLAVALLGGWLGATAGREAYGVVRT